MPEFQHPSELEPKLSRAHLDVVFNNLLDAAYKALEATLNRPGFFRHLASSLHNAFQTLPVTADC